MIESGKLKCECLKKPDVVVVIPEIFLDGEAVGSRDSDQKPRQKQKFCHVCKTFLKIYKRISGVVFHVRNTIMKVNMHFRL